MTYEDPTEDDDAKAIQDVAGNDAAGFSGNVRNNSTVAPGTPGAPRNLEATADGQSRIDLAWDPPTDDGGRTVTGYRIEYHDGACTTPYTGTWTMLATDTGSDDTEFTDNGGGNGLAPGTTRCYRAYAINSEGTGTDASNEDAATTDATTPDAPGALMAAVNGRQVTLSWTTPANGGSAITEYEYRQSTDGGMNWTVWMDISGSGPTTTSQPRLQPEGEHGLHLRGAGGECGGERRRGQRGRHDTGGGAGDGGAGPGGGSPTGLRIRPARAMAGCSCGSSRRPTTAARR